jgi:endonuclease/exonuclease/phosphatase (EEP) superfamily protein YafD
MPPTTSPRSVARWAADLAELPGPQHGVLRVLAGDFNATLDHGALRRVLALGYRDAARTVGLGLRATWTPLRSPHPRLTLDHVLVDPQVGVASVTLVPVAGSDHRAVVAELVLPQRGG